MNEELGSDYQQTKKIFLSPTLPERLGPHEAYYSFTG
jgi:hypothetical protein